MLSVLVRSVENVVRQPFLRPASNCRKGCQALEIVSLSLAIVPDPRFSVLRSKLLVAVKVLKNRLRLSFFSRVARLKRRLGQVVETVRSTERLLSVSDS